MSLSTKDEHDLATLQGDITALKQDLAKLVEHLKLGAANGTQGAVDHLEAGARHLYGTIASEAERSAAAVSHQIDKQPVAALLIALGVGYVGGRLMSR